MEYVEIDGKLDICINWEVVVSPEALAELVGAVYEFKKSVKREPIVTSGPGMDYYDVDSFVGVRIKCTTIGKPYSIALAAALAELEGAVYEFRKVVRRQYTKEYKNELLAQPSETHADYNKIVSSRVRKPT